LEIDEGADNACESRLGHEHTIPPPPRAKLTPLGPATQIFSVPKTSRKLKPFIDHVLTFSLLDNKIWFRNYQIVEKDPLKPSGPPQTSLVEIGPRFVLTPIRIFEGSFGGPTVYENPGTLGGQCVIPYRNLLTFLSSRLTRACRIHLTSSHTSFHQARTGTKVPTKTGRHVRQGGASCAAARGTGRGRVGTGSGVCLVVQCCCRCFDRAGKWLSRAVGWAVCIFI
jgi:hypothetical protein